MRLTVFFRVAFFTLALCAWPASEALATLQAPTVNLAPGSIAGAGTSTLTITLDNNPPGNPNNIAFSYNYPANVFNASTASNTCGGTATATVGGTSLSLSGGSITGNNICTVTVTLTSCNAGSYNIGGFGVTSTSGNPTAGSDTLTVTSNSPASAANSTVSASPGSVAADGIASSTITVTLRNACGGPAAGKTVTLTQAGGSSNISPASQVTNASGVATFTVTNLTAQTVTYTANVAAESVTVSQTAAVTFTRIAAPTVAKSFSPTAVGLNTNSTLSITITNPNNGTIAGLAFTDNYPGGLVNAPVPGISNSCGGTATAAAGGGSLTLSGGSVAGKSSCTVSVSVRSASAGSYNNSTGTVTSNNANNGAAAAAALRVNNPPTVAKAFSPTAVGVDGDSTLTITITNPNPVAINGVAFNDAYPANLVTSPAPGLTNSCGGTAGTTSGSVSLSGGSIAASSSCAVSVKVRSSTAGSYNNSTGAVSTTDAGNGAAANATLTVNNTPGVAKSFSPTSVNQNIPSTLTITLSNSNAAAVTGVAFVDTYPANLVTSGTPNLVNTCGGTATTAAGTLSLSGGTIPASGSCTVSVSVQSATAGSYLNSTGTVTSTNAGSGGPATATLTVSPNVASFNIVDTGGHPVSGVIKTKVAGLSFALDIVARDGSNNIATGFTGEVLVELVNNSGGGACNALPQVKPLANQTFVSGDNGRHAMSGVVENDAYRNLRVRVSYPSTSPTVISCSTDAFANRPSQFDTVLARNANRTTAGTTDTLNSTANPGSGVVHNAGRPFRIDFTARNNAGAATGNYSPGASQPVVVLSQCGVAAVCPAAPGVLALGTLSTSAGVVSTTTASYNDVGAFNLTLQDQSFADVDAADGSTAAERYIVSAPVTVGRFVPDFFAVSAGSSITPRSDIGACSGSSFTYMSERMDLVFTLTARAFDGGSGTVTPSYTGATLGALPLNSAASWSFGARDSAGPTPLTARVDTSLIATMGASWSNGTASIAAPIALSRAATPDGPYGSLQIGIAPSDPDGVTLAGGFDLDADDSGTPERLQIGAATAVRFGRIRMSNATGRETLDLVMPITAQYWNGSGFITNAADNCTPLDVANFSLGTYSGGISAANLPAGNISWGGSFAAGVGSLRLNKPSPAPTAAGSVILTLDLVAEAKSYLQGNWAGATYTFNPSARAAFGVYGAKPNNFIFFRENY